MSTENHFNPGILPPGGGQPYHALGVSLTIKTNGSDSGGQWFVLEYEAPPNFPGPPPHWHKVMTEIFYVLDGCMTFRVGEQSLEVGPGGYTYITPGTVHAFSNQTGAPAKFLVIASPNLLEQYFVEMMKLVEAEPQWPPQDMGKVIALMAKYDMYQPGAQP